MADHHQSFEWTLNGQSKIHDGYYGPVFLAMRTDNGKLLWAERIGPQEPASLLPTHEERPVVAVKSYGCHRKDNGNYLLRKYVQGTTLTAVIRQHQEHISLAFVRNVVQTICKGMEEAARQGRPTWLMDTRNIWLEDTKRMKIDFPDLGVPLSRPLLPQALLTAPEIIHGHENVDKLDVWLLGIVAARMISGKADLVADYTSAVDVGLQVREAQGSALNVIMPGFDIDDEQARDFLARCFTISSSDRPSMTEISQHAWLS